MAADGTLTHVTNAPRVRYILRVEPLASAEHDTVVACVAPTLERYLIADLQVRSDEPPGSKRGADRR